MIGLIVGWFLTLFSHVVGDSDVLLLMWDFLVGHHAIYDINNAQKGGVNYCAYIVAQVLIKNLADFGDLTGITEEDALLIIRNIDLSALNTADCRAILNKAARLIDKYEHIQTSYESVTNGD